MAGRSAARLTPSEGRRFGLTVGSAFAVLAAVAIWRHHAPMGWTLGTLAVLLVGGGLVVPARMGPVHYAWMAMARAISKVTTPIVMSIVYFLVITPTGLIRRTLGRHPLEHPEEEGGHWVTRDSTRSDLERQF